MIAVTATTEADPSVRSPTPPPTRQVRLQGVEAGRGIAALFVVFYHAALHIETNVPGARVLWGIPHFGHAGVDFFFVLSGFIISYVHRRDIGNPHQVGHYLQRRFTRVFPFYWLVLSYYMLDTWLLHRSAFPSATDVITSIFLFPHGNGPIVGGGWTLVLEVMFYIVFSVNILSRRIGAATLVVWGLAVATGLVVQPQHGHAILGAVMSPFCLEFFLGMAAATIANHRDIPGSRTLLIVSLVAFAIAGCLEDAGQLNGYGTIARLVYGGCSVPIILAIVDMERRGQLRVPRLMAVLGRASYAVYLVHLVAIGITYKLLSMAVTMNREWALPLWGLLCSTGVICGVLASIWIEQPVIRLVRTRVFGARP